MLRYISHPQVHVDAAVAVPRWHLSDEGRRRAQRMLEQPWCGDVRRIVASDEMKAVETAEVLAGHRGLTVEVRPATGEIGRSAAGFLPPDEFERVTDECFARPDRSARGWERAVDAQRRIVAALADLVGRADASDDGDGDVAVVGHGGVGTLWWCHLAGEPIARRFDQPGQGHYFGVDRATARPLHPWRPIDGL